MSPDKSKLITVTSEWEKRGNLRNGYFDSEITSKLEVFDITSSEKLYEVKKPYTFTVNGDLIYIACDGKKIHIRDINTGELLAVLKHNQGMSAISISDDGQIIAAKGCCNDLKLWIFDTPFDQYIHNEYQLTLNQALFIELLYKHKKENKPLYFVEIIDKNYSHSLSSNMTSEQLNSILGSFPSQIREGLINRYDIRDWPWYKRILP